MPEFSTTVGNVEIMSLSDGHIQFPPSDFFPSIEPNEWEPYKEMLTPEGRLNLNMASFLMRSGGKTVLVDTGLGGDSSTFDFASSGKLMNDFKAKGVSPDEIDIVMITHLHRDHVGWNISYGLPSEVSTGGGADTRVGEQSSFSERVELTPTFPNARYFVPEADWVRFKRLARNDDFAYIREQVLPLEDLGILELFEGEVTLTPELTTLPTPGHTPGHTSVLITSDGQKAIVAGDATHVPAQAQEPHWSPRADSDPKLSAESRNNIMDRMEQDHGLLICGHYPYPGFGKLLRVEGRRYWQAI